MFMHLLPILHNVRGNVSAAEEIMTLMLQVPLKLTLQTQALQKVKTPLYSRLGKTRLGTEMTTGNTRNREETDEVRIVVGSLNHNAFCSFMRGGYDKKILDSLCDYLLPVHVDVCVLKYCCSKLTEPCSLQVKV